MSIHSAPQKLCGETMCPRINEYLKISNGLIFIFFLELNLKKITVTHALQKRRNFTIISHNTARHTRYARRQI